jgi:hypothetical protein
MEANLFDLHQKYADVVTLEQTLADLEKFAVGIGTTT